MPHKIELFKSSANLKKILKITFEILLASAVVLLTVYFFPHIMRLRDAQVREEVRVYVQDSGIFGVLLMLGLQLVQVILSVIPGEPVEVLFGFIYGPWVGALLCLSGITLGSFAVFCTTRFLGKKIMKSTETNDKFKKLNFLKDPKKRDVLIFFLFFLPGTPKDTLTYFAPFTKIELWKFLLVTTVARFPSVITSTFAGESIFTGNYVDSVIIFGVTGAIGIIGILAYNFILSKNKEK
jgi:uncharacterized membrane protein YdjX (TVP38/TMEM64 family)